MRTLLTISLIACFLISGCDEGMDAYYNNGVEQLITKASALDGLICDNCELLLQTKVWYNQQIYKSWYDSFDKLDTALAKKRILQGDSVLKIIKLINK